MIIGPEEIRGKGVRAHVALCIRTNQALRGYLRTHDTPSGVHPLNLVF